jgi:hypothetical protein
MKRAYTALMNELERRVAALRLRARHNDEKFSQLMLKEFGLEVKPWK